jgi:hypothetical protein
VEEAEASVDDRLATALDEKQGCRRKLRRRPLSRGRIAHSRYRGAGGRLVFAQFRLYKAVNATTCARVDSNHHGENSPQGPQPDPPGVDGSAGVQIVHSASVSGRIGRIWRHDFCQAFVTNRHAGIEVLVAVLWFPDIGYSASPLLAISTIDD